MTTVLIALGANLPIDATEGESPPAATLRAALADLAIKRLAPARISQLFLTPCMPAGAGPDYVNAAAAIHSDAEPDAILDILHRIEARFARTRVSRWAGRTLDLDLLAVGDALLPDAATHRRWRDLSSQDQRTLAPDRLILPHPRMQDRAFVLVPLAEVAPDWCHPALRQTVRQMRDALDPADIAAVRPLA